MSQVWTWRHAIWESDLSSTTKLVLQALASHLNDMGGPMFPSQERLAKLCSLSERAIITHLDVAEQAGWIQARKRDLNGKRWAANEYAARFPDGVNKVHPTAQDGVKDVQPRGEGRSVNGVKDVHTNSPALTSTETSTLPLTPTGPGVGVWDDDSQFMELLTAYALLNPDRADARKAWDVWVAKGLKPSFGLIMRALPSFAQRLGWKKDERRYVPALSKWLGDEEWRQVAAGIPTAEELAEQRRISKDGLAAHARIETDKMRGRPPSAADIEAVQLWQAQQARLAASRPS